MILFFFESQIWASQGGGQHKPPTDLVFRQKASWGVGKETKTVLKDSDGQVCVCVCQFADEDVEDGMFALELLSSQVGVPLNYLEFTHFCSRAV